MNLHNKAIAIATLSAVVGLAGCGSSAVVKNSIRINPGDSKQVVMDVMGDPGNRQFYGQDEAWQYCDTDYGLSDRGLYRIVWFANGKVTGMTSYQINIPSALTTGGCTAHFKEIRWEEAPDRIDEHRIR